jgi:hypothetical protein
MIPFLNSVFANRCGEIAKCVWACLLMMLSAGSIRAAVLKAEYNFNGNLGSSVPGAPPLIPVNPLGPINDDGTTRSAVIRPPIGSQFFRLSNP